MTCDIAIDLILEADPSTLQGLGDGALAEHLRGCHRCRSAAEVVLEEEQHLSEAMARTPRVIHPMLVLAAAEAEGMSLKAQAPRPRERWKPRPLTMAVLASAAALVALLLGQTPRLPGPEYIPRESVGVGLDVQVPDGRTAAVLKTNNPNITVLWLF